MKQGQEDSLNKLHKGINTDIEPSLQPEGSYRFALNTLIKDGSIIQNEEGNEQRGNVDTDANYIPIGKCYIGNGETFVILVNNTFNNVVFSILDSNGNSRRVLFFQNNGIFGLSTEKDLQMVFRLRKGCERIVYFVDGKNKPRCFNIDKAEDYYLTTTPTYTVDVDKFNLIKTTDTVLKIEDIEIEENGSLMPGSYNIGVQLLDEDYNPTEVITTSRVIKIYNDKASSAFEDITGATGEKTDYYNYSNTSKAISFSLSDIDSSYNYLRFFLIAATSGSGLVTSVTFTDPMEINENIRYSLTGTNTPHNSTLDEIFKEKINITSADTITQLDNRLILGNIKGTQEDLCSLQKYASKIKSDLVIKEVSLNSTLDASNPKNGVAEFTGYMPGEIYAFGIVYIFDDGTQSPAYHIPGASALDTATRMDTDNAATNLVYPTKDNCGPNDYWGVDRLGDSLVGEPVRHHRFPFRSQALYGVNHPNPGTALKLFNKTAIAGTDSDQYLHLGRTYIAGTFNTNYKAPNFYLKVKYNTSRPEVAEGLEKDIIFENPNYQFLNPNTLNYDTGATGYQTYFCVSYLLSELIDSNPDDHIYQWSYDTGKTYFYTNGDFNTEIPTSGGEFPYSAGVVSYNESDIGEIIGADITVGNKTLTDISDIEMAILRHFNPVGYTIHNTLFPTGTIITAISNSVKEITISEFPTGSINDGSCTIDTLQGFDTQQYDYSSHIMGIRFSEVQLPPRVQGYYIVRMERDESNKTILDNGLITRLVKEDDYVAFGHLQPQGKTTAGEYFALFNPEYKFNSKEHASFDIIQEGYYSIDEKFVTRSITEDCMPGTSYNAEVASRRETADSDGFDLHGLVRYTNTSFDVDNSVPMATDSFYLDALSYSYKDVSGTPKKIFNASSDNKVAIVDGTGVSLIGALPYIAMKKNIADPYYNYLTGAYYKQTDNIQTGTTVDVFSGDAYVTPINYASTIYYDTRLRNRHTKTGLWKIIGGSLLALVGVLAAVGTLGLSTAASTMAVSYGLSLLSSGIKQKRMSEVYEEEYDKGLRDVIDDNDTNMEFSSNPQDDEIQWFMDVLPNIWIESSVNMGLRVMPTYGNQAFLPCLTNYNPVLLNNYLLNKLTVLDSNNDNGRLYQGFVTSELYLLNKDYQRFNKEKVWFMLSSSYDCCSECKEDFPHRVYYSQQSFQEELTDNYRIVLANNYRDIDGETGKITNLFTIQNNLYIHTEDCLWHLPQNLQERVLGSIVTFIGTGDYFALPPRKIVDSETGLAIGSSSKTGTLKTPFGVVFQSNNDSKIYMFNGSQAEPISDMGLKKYFNKNGNINLIKINTDEVGNKLLPGNPVSKYGVGYISVLDSQNNRILITKKDFKVLNISSYITQGDNTDYRLRARGDNFLIYPDYQYWTDYYLALGYIENTLNPTNSTRVFTKTTYVPLTNTYSQQTVTLNAVPILATDIIDLSWTMSFNLETKSWASWHSYLPNAYFQLPNKFFSWIYTSRAIWEHNIEGLYQTYYGVLKPQVIEYVSNEGPTQTKIFDFIKFITEAQSYDADSEEFLDERYITFNKALFYNSRQNSGVLTLVPKDVTSPDYIMNQTVNNQIGEVVVSKNEETWAVNELRDYRIDYTKPMFNSNPENLQANYFIDKELNTAVIDFEKNWQDLESFRDKYLIVRLIFDTFGAVKLLFNFSMENNRASAR